jgi:hypothetical protein
LYHERRTAPAGVEGEVARSWVAFVKFEDAFGMGELETVNRLVFVTHDYEVGVLSQYLKELLLRAVQVLVLVHKDMLKVGY